MSLHSGRSKFTLIKLQSIKLHKLKKIRNGEKCFWIKSFKIISSKRFHGLSDTFVDWLRKLFCSFISHFIEYSGPIRLTHSLTLDSIFVSWETLRVSKGGSTVTESTFTCHGVKFNFFFPLPHSSIHCLPWHHLQRLLTNRPLGLLHNYHHPATGP